jgi:RNA polymerase sigma-70 factor (ECF subfamily)
MGEEAFLCFGEYVRILRRMDQLEKNPLAGRGRALSARGLLRRSDPLADPEPLMDRVYAYCAYRLGNGQDAEDAASDTFERALRHRSSYDPRKGTPSAWLIGIARRCIDDVVAARLPIVEELPAQTAPEDDAAMRLDVAQMLARLDPHDRELIALRYGADLTARQIGELLQMRAHAVEMALHRALVRLRAELEREQRETPLEALHTGSAA